METTVTRESLDEAFLAWCAANHRDNSMESAQDFADEWTLAILTAKVAMRKVAMRKVQA